MSKMTGLRTEVKKEPRSYQIILIEDDPDLCQGWLDLFEMLGHRVVCYRRALEALRDRGAILSFDLLITDYYLPDLNGVELIGRVREINPELVAILLTGSREQSVVEAAGRIPKCFVMHKPLNIDDLEKRMSEAFGSADFEQAESLPAGF